MTCTRPCSRAPSSIADSDPWLAPYRAAILQRGERARAAARRLTGGTQTLPGFASAHAFYGLHRAGNGWVFTEWAPNADGVCLIGECSDWQEREPFSPVSRAARSSSSAFAVASRLQ